MISKAQNAHTPSHDRGFLWILAWALLLFALKAAIAVNDPFFGGDQGHRVHHADWPVTILGNRVWLPFLQLHVWVFHLLHLPYYTYKLIPCFYFFVAVASLGVIGYKLGGRSRSALVFSLVLMLCFAQQRVISNLSISLYQEIIGVGMFYWLLSAGALDFKRSRLLLAVAGLAMLTRDSFWIYLFAFTLLHWREILFQKTYRDAFMLLWAVPVLWILAIPFGYLVFFRRLPEIPTEWPLMINKRGDQAVSDLGTSLASLWSALVTSQALFLLVALIVVSVVGVLCFRNKPDVAQRHHFASRFKPFSLLSLGIIYTLFVLFDPWEATFGNPRAALPLVEHAFVWVAILYAKTSEYSQGWEVLARTILVGGMLLSLSPLATRWIPPDHSRAEAYHAEIKELLVERGGNDAQACFVGESTWKLRERFLAATLHTRKRFFQRGENSIPDTCDVVLLEEGFQLTGGEYLEKHGVWELKGVSFTIYSRPLQP